MAVEEGKRDSRGELDLMIESTQHLPRTQACPPRSEGHGSRHRMGSEIHFGGKTMFFCVLPNWSLLTNAASGYPPGASVVRGGGLGGHRERASEGERVYERAREFESFPFFTPTENNGCSAFLTFPSLARPQELPHHQQGTVTSRPVLG